MNNLVETYNLAKLNQEESDNLNRQITTSETEAVIKKLQHIKALDPIASQVNVTEYSETN